MSQRSRAQRFFYAFLRFVSRLLGVTLFGLRCFGRHRMPTRGAVLVCSNHQSTLDPVLIGLTFDRRLNYLARKSLFGFRPFRLLIEFLDAIPIDRDGVGIAGLKEALRRIRRGEIVLIFPEGTRTKDGEVGPLQSGFCALARRTEVALLPVGIDGAFQAWPRDSWWPRLSRVIVCVGTPLESQQVRQMSDSKLVEELGQRIRRCHTEARSRRSR